MQSVGLEGAISHLQSKAKFFKGNKTDLEVLREFKKSATPKPNVIWLIWAFIYILKMMDAPLVSFPPMPVHTEVKTGKINSETILLKLQWGSE